MTDEDIVSPSDLDEPPAEFGPIPLWWWDGDELDERRLTDQLESLAQGGVSGVCIIEKHPTGYAGDEHDYFSEEWWDHVEHVARECDRLEMELWVHDETYHHSPPNHRKFWQHRLETEAGTNADLRGEALRHVGRDAPGGTSVELELPRSFTPISAGAYPRSDDGELSLEDGVEIEVAEGATHLRWTAPDGDERWHVGVVGREPSGLCYTRPHAVERYLELHFEEYVRRLGDLVGDVLVGTFEDELLLLQPEYPHDETINVPAGDHVLDRFREEHGYDPEQRLVTMFEDAGDETARLRADYYDVVTTLLEECWFEPLYEWHETYGLRRSHDNFGRLSLAKQTVQYGDYVRTMRWYQAPGYDDGNIDPKAIETKHDIPIGERNFFDARLAASIAATYERPRVWGELFHSTGWGYPPESQLAGVAENVCYGMNCYDKHGLYYSTKGGWWEHAPPDTHFRQPYWEHVRRLNDAASRLGYLFSLGEPGFDVAVYYPATTMQSRWHPKDGIDRVGHDVDDETRDVLESLYLDGWDPAFLDRDSLVRADTDDGRIRVGDVDVPALVLGPTTTIRDEALAAIREFHDAGGTVIATSRLPTALVGDFDKGTLDDALEDVFGSTTVPETGHEEHEGSTGGVGILAAGDTSVSMLLGSKEVRGVDAPEGIYHGHRRTAVGEVYLLLNTSERRRTETITLRGDGEPELWDLLDGERSAIEYDRSDDGVTVTVSFAPYEHHVVVIGDEQDTEPASRPTPTAGGGRHRSTGGRTIELNGQWDVEPSPVLDNDWGDFRYPRDDDTLGPEVRTFRHRAEPPETDGVERGWPLPGGDEEWDPVAWSVGPYCWRFVSEDGSVPPAPSASRDGWTPYEFSERTGVDDLAPNFGGLVGRVSENFLSAPDRGEAVHFWTTVRTSEPEDAVCHYGPGVERLAVGDRTVVGGAAIEPPDGDDGASIALSLPAGSTPIRVMVAPGTDTYLAFERAPATADENRPADVPRLPWFNGTDALAFDAKPWEDRSVGWYRFEIPPGTRGFTVPVAGSATVWVDGRERSLQDGRVDLETAPSKTALVAVRVVQSLGRYGGATWTSPVKLDVGAAKRPLEDWRDLGFDGYSGMVRYAKTVALPAVEADERVILDLGGVAVSASASVDGTRVGERFARPYRFDVTDAVTAGENRIEIEVANTLANHFAAEVPTKYVYDDLDRRRSGLFGPVTVDVVPE